MIILPLTLAYLTLPPPISASPPPNIGGCASGTMTNSEGPSQGANQPCVFPFTFQKKKYTSCLSMNVPASQLPFLSSGSKTPGPGDYWCATVAQYGGNTASNPNRKFWGFCDCTPSTSTTSTPTTSGTSTAPFYTDGGLVPENTACQFPLRKGTTSYHACIPMSDPPRTPAGAVVTPPQWSGSTTWCYAGSQIASQGNAVNYNSLSDTEKGLWGYCVDASQQTLAPTPAIPTQGVTSPPSTWIPGSPTFMTSGGYAEEDSPCTFPFTIAATGKTFKTCAPYLPNTKNGPWINSLNPPAQPVPPTTNTTWCYTGTGNYDTKNRVSRKNWGFCHEFPPVPPTNTPTTSMPTSTTSAPTLSMTPTMTQATMEPTFSPTTATPTTKKPTAAPTKKGETLEPTMVPTTATPTTASPTTLMPSSMPTVTHMPSTAPIARPNVTNAPQTSSPTIASAPPSNSSKAPTAAQPSGTQHVHVGGSAAVVVAVTLIVMNVW